MAADLGSFDLVISDFDGTLCHLNVDWESVRQRFQMSSVEEGWTLTGSERDEFWDFVTREEVQAVKDSEPVDRVVAWLESARIIVVLTNNSEVAVHEFLRRSDMSLAAKVVGVVGRETLRGSKRRQEVFTTAINECCSFVSGADPSKILYVGDMAYELEYASELGLLVSDARGTELLVQNWQ